MDIGIWGQMAKIEVELLDGTSRQFFIKARCMFKREFLIS